MGDVIRYLADDNQSVEVQEREDGERVVVARLWAFNQPGRNQLGEDEYIKPGAATYDHVVFEELHDVAKGIGKPEGSMIAFDEREDGAYAVLSVEDTSTGLDFYKRLKKKLYRHVSPGFVSIESHRETINGIKAVVHDRIKLLTVGATWRPAYAAAQIVQVRQEDEREMSEKTETQPEAPKPVLDAVQPAPDFRAMIAEAVAPLRDQLGAMADTARSAISLPGGDEKDARSALHRWMPAAVRHLAGERIPTAELRELAAVISTDNLGVVPESVMGDIIGIIDPSRPFMESTSKVAEPDGMKLVYPKIITRPTVGIQVTEKTEIVSTASSVTAVDFDSLTIAGGADISIQLIRKSSPSFLDLFMRLLAEAYAQNTDAAAVGDLLAEVAVVEGGVFDPAAPTYGSAFTNGLAAGRGLTPDRIWLSTAAAAEALDAGTIFGAGAQSLDGGVDRRLALALQPVHTPALDATLVDVLIGPSRGFAWAEAGAFQLAADNPTKLGRDVALAGIVWFAPLYPAAFTSYTLPI